MSRLAIVCTHPIQYYVPLFKLLSRNKNHQVMVFYTWGEQSIRKSDPGFGKVIEWDIPLLDGYHYTFIKNISRNPGSASFRGIITPSLISVINLFKPDAILIFGWAYYGHMKAIRHFSSKIPVWFRGDSTLLQTQNPFKAILRSLCLKWIYKHIDLAYFVGSENKRYYKHFGLKDKQLCFAPHAIDNTRFKEASEHEAMNLKQALCIPDDHLILLFAGKLEAIKNPVLLLNAFININLPKVHLIYVGDGHLKEKLKKKAANHSHIHFVGFQNQSKIPLYYKACDLFCLPSKSETWGLAVNEAMACGKAILVSSKVGSGIDLVKPGINGEIFLSDNLDSLEKKLLLLFKSREGLKRRGELSLQIVDKWTHEQTSKVILDKLDCLE